MLKAHKQSRLSVSLSDIECRKIKMEAAWKGITVADLMRQKMFPNEPNEESIKAMKETDDYIKTGKGLKSYSSLEEMFEDCFKDE